jgi:deoxycytidylate deaminase
MKRPAPDRPPTIDETLMTIAYCLSKRSSCVKRKVGAVIAHIAQFEELKDRDPREDSHIQFQVLSGGYNDVPLGSPACVFMNSQNCYRDHLKQSQAKRIKCCPNCGESIPNKIACPYCSKKNPVGDDTCKNCIATIPAYKCTKCKTEVFRFLSAGEDESQSKLLDMCRSLHAEENAIIGLTGVNKTGKGEIVLYTTTYPCNLCANKIVAAGINKVVFAEPYTIKEAEKILAGADIDVVKFKGVKSTAYFRVYS